MVVEEEGGEFFSHVPLDVVGEHATADAIRSVVVDGSDLEVHGFEAAEGALDAGEALVGADGVVGVEAFGLDVGADDVDAASCSSAVICSWMRSKEKESSVIWGSKCLATLYRSMTFPTRMPMASLPRRGRLGRRVACAMGSRSFSVASFERSAEARIAADDEPFAGEVVALDFGEVPLVEQGGVHRFVGDEFPDGGGAQGGDPAQPLDSGEILPDAGGGEHAPISHQDHAGEAEAEAELVHLAGHRLRVAGVAFEDFDRHPSGEQSSPKTIWSLFFLPSL